MSSNYFTNICGGTVNYKTIGHVDFNMKRLDAYKKDVKKHMFPKPITNDIKTGDGLLKEVIKQWKLDMSLTHSIGFLHNQICILYNNIIEQSPINIKYIDRDRPGNYTPDSAKLANIYWDSFGPNLIQGYCPCEPMVRLKQLAEFPIQEFTYGEIILNIDIKLPPKIKPKAQLIGKNLYEQIKNLKTYLLQYEEYYKKILPIIELLTLKIMEKNAKF